MKEIKRKRIWAARILLSVFLPMAMWLSVHTHGPAAHGDGDCYQCAHQLPHSGHLTAAQASLHDCVLCQFHSVLYLFVPTTMLSAGISFSTISYPDRRQTAAARTKGSSRPRGPPFI